MENWWIPIKSFYYYNVKIHVSLSICYAFFRPLPEDSVTRSCTCKIDENESTKYVCQQVYREKLVEKVQSRGWCQHDDACVHPDWISNDLLILASGERDFLNRFLHFIHVYLSYITHITCWLLWISSHHSSAWVFFFSSIIVRWMHEADKCTFASRALSGKEFWLGLWIRFAEILNFVVVGFEVLKGRQLHD